MVEAPKPPDEERRLAALHALSLLDTEPEERFDRITRLAQRVFGTTMATFTLVDADRQWFKSDVGAAGKEDPRSISFCSHTILDPDRTVIEDARTLCVIDDKPRAAADFDAEALAEFAAMVEAEVASLSLAIGDELTGLANRRGFEMLGERLLTASRRLELPLSVIYSDLDNMKPINDTYGHEAGDEALVALADAQMFEVKRRKKAR